MGREATFRTTLPGIVFLAALLTAAWGCTDADGVGVTESPKQGSSASVLQPSRLELISGDAQSSTVGTSVGDPLAVKITNAAGSGIEGLNVSWTVTEGGGSLESVTSVTDASGIASQAGWTLGTRAGENRLLASVAGLSSAAFTAEARPGKPEFVSLSPPEIDLKVGDSEKLQATAADVYGNAITEGLIWTASNPGVASLGGKGVVTALFPGTATITASIDGVSASSILSVSAPPATGILPLEGQSQKGPAGKSLSKPLVIEVRDDSGSPVPGVAVEWAVTKGGGSLEPATSSSVFASSQPTLASSRTVSNKTDASGQAAAIWTLGPSQGTNTVTASVAGAGTTVFVATSEPGAPASITVNPSAASLSVGQALVLSADVLDDMGNPVSTSVEWSSSAPSVAEVNASTGQVTARSVGTATITAVSGDARGTAAITAIAVTPEALVSVSGDGQSATVGEILGNPLVVEVRDGSGSPLSGVTVEWAVTGGDGSLSLSAGTTDESGRAEARWTLGKTAGSNEVSAAVSGLPSVGFTASGQAGPAASVAVTPDAFSLSVGETADLTAMARDAYGNAAPDPISWNSLAPETAAVDGDGRVTGVSSGKAAIEAAAGEVKATSEAVVSTESPGSMSVVSGSEQTGAVGSTLESPLVVQVLGAGGDPMEGIGVQWAVTQGGGTLSHASTLTDASGEAKVIWTLGTAIGTGQVTATVAGVPAATFSSIATAGPVAKVTVSPDPASVKAGGTVSFSALAEDEYGNPVSTSFSWSSSNESVAMIGSSSGIATGLVAGTVVITALACEVSGSSTLSVEVVPIPEAVSDLSVAQSTESSVSLDFTEVDDGQGEPASYQLRYYMGSADWESAIPVGSGPCAGSFDGTGIGNLFTCPVDGLEADNTYSFVVRSHRIDSEDVMIPGDVSNVAEGTTEAIDSSTPASLSIVSGDGQTGTAGSTLEAPLVLEVQDASGTPMGGVAVNWAVTQGAGTVSSSSTTTDSQGRAQVAWTLGSEPGTNVAVAGVDGVAGVEYTASGVVAESIGNLHPNEPAGMTTIVSADGSVAEANGDAFGEPLFSGWYGYSGGGSQNVTVVDDPDNPTGSSKAVRFKWDETTNEAAIANLAFPAETAKTIYIMHRVVIESGWADFGHKWFYIVPNGASAAGAGLWTAHEGNGQLRVLDGTQHHVAWTENGALDARDQEFAIEYLFVAESAPHAGDGQVFLWVNGVEMTGSSSMYMAAADQTYTTIWKYLRYYNKTNTVPSTSYHRVREFYVSGRDY